MRADPSQLTQADNPMDATDSLIEAIAVDLKAMLANWELSPQTDIRLLSHSENTTFLADDPSRGRSVVLRVHRIGYHTVAEIESELAWIEALIGAGVVQTPPPVPARDGRRMITARLGGADRQVVAFSLMSGVEPDPSMPLAAWYAKLGAVNARLHEHARRWTRPTGFRRKTWDFDAMLGSRPLWGDWRAAPGLDAQGIALLERVSRALRARLDVYGAGKERFGLVHADMRLANLLVDGERLGVIDFDDCGFSWFMYDFAAAASFIEDVPTLPELQAAWLAGYRTVAPILPADEAMLPTFLMLRRMLLTAWIASHAETLTARSLGAPYAHGTVAMGIRYLATV